ncbi:plasmid partitioning protein RepB [Sinorhizobium prairiense]|uniref:plasmid partitioning protein RepB n=1 Tax=unclassified Sinorhizobium TaxID=2613772 RepID=UPI0023D883EC|nr:MULTISPECIES: plasmid partitioning protein RepB [unclassified Sinorhizobium]WEJ08461.1 plasmid partitioning protein RepB [Sinorhizobium sp. M103]WEJ14036.1 plasmid partitioning protein RepB [Sinorhizobium sp. K101]WEJ35635.1 plasmid partitioning protein RepB [Sinorhizobium sp. C101]
MTNPRDRNQRMKSLFANVNPDELVKPSATMSADAEKRRVGSVAVKSMDRAFVSIEEENKRLHEQLLSAESIIEIDPDNVVPSFVSDRLDIEGDRTFEAFVEGIREAGQKLPILVRPLPGRPGHYQAAYGHRRLRACRILKRSVKAIVRDLSDEELIISQGIENSERLNLSFIEQALFALTLKEKGYSRETIAEALGRKEQRNVAYISFLTNAAAALPEDLIRLIGSAPSIGRPKWEKLGALIQNRSLNATQRHAVEALTSNEDWALADSDQRFSLVLGALDNGGKPESTVTELAIEDGSVVVAKRSGNAMTISIPEKRIPGLSAWLLERLPDLVKEYRATQKEGS